MPTWSDILKEIRLSAIDGGRQDIDGVRRKYLYRLHEHTGRNVILYASGWIQRDGVPSNFISIGDEDIHALMEVNAGLNGPDLDLILHSPGGSIDADEAIVDYLRSRFSHIRVIVPNLAMSAATMIACAADEIVMGNHSFLGPTDAQIPLATPLGTRYVPAQDILDQFDQAQKDCADPAKLAAWLPMLNQYGPDLLVRCETALELSRELVRKWLESYMFRGDSCAEEKANRISAWLANHQNFKSHSRHIPREEFGEQGLTIAELENDQTLQDLALSVFHAAAHTFEGTPAVKIVENHTGRAFIKINNSSSS